MRKREYKKPDRFNMLCYLIEEIAGALWCYEEEDYERTLWEALTVIWEFDKLVLRELNLPCNLEEAVQKKTKGIAQSVEEGSFREGEYLRNAENWVWASDLRMAIERDLVNAVSERWEEIREERKENG